MAEYHDGLHLEHSKGTRDQTPLHTIRTEANNGRPIKGISNTKKILETETGRPSVPTISFESDPERQDLRKKLKFFRVPEAIIDPIGVKLVTSM